MSKDRKTKVITRRVLAEDLPDLLTSPPRATLAFVVDGRLDAVPVGFRYDSGRYLCRVSEKPASLIPGRQVYLLVDDGEFYAELRGIGVAGKIGDGPALLDESDTGSWLEVVPDRIRAWHYGMMRRKAQ